MVTRDRERDEHRHERRRERDRSGKIDVAPRRLVHDRRERDEADRHRQDPYGNVHVEDPAPAQVVSEISADSRPNDRRQPEDPAEDALQLRALGGGIEVADGREDAGEEHAAEDPLDAPKCDELGHVLGLPAERGRQDESDHPSEQKRLAAEEIPEFARDGSERRRRDQICRCDPRVVLEAIEVGDDPRERGADDRLIERREEQGEPDPNGRQDPCVSGHLTGHSRSPW